MVLKKIAITGNIASGKSQVEAILKSKGLFVYDTDAMTHDILNSLQGFYDYDIMKNGKIDRLKLGKLVFSDSNAKEKLEKLVHPKIRLKIMEIFNFHKNDLYVFISVPLLYEAGFQNLFDKVLFVSVDKNVQLNRLMQRNNYTFEEAELRINSQIPQEEKSPLADYVIVNNSSLDDLKQKVEDYISYLISNND